MSKRKTPGGSENVNSAISDMLLELADYEKNQRAIHKYNAYRKAAAAIGRHPTQITSGEEAKALPGVGAKIAAKIDELLATGKLNKLEKIRKDDTSVAVKDLTRVSGIGPVLAHQLVKDGITSVQELREAEAALKGKKSRLNHAQQLGLKYLEDLEQRIPRAETADLEDYALTAIKNLDSKYIALVCGSYRRGAETSGDIDILITHPNYLAKDSAKNSTRKKLLGKVVEALSSDDFIKDTIAMGDTKFMGICKHPDHSTHRRIDVTLLPFGEYWCGVLYFTGSDEFNRQMRATAQEKGYTLNEHSLRKLGTTGKAGDPVPVNAERDLFDYLGMDWKEPHERNF